MKTLPVFEIYLEGSDVRPEDIPLAVLSQILSAVQRLTSGTSVAHADSESDERSLRLLNIKGGSTTLPIYVPAQDYTINQMRRASEIIGNPDTIGDNDYILGCAKDLSAASRLLGCPIVIRKPGRRGEVLTVVNEETYQNITKNVFVKGTTSILGKVERVGNATGARCGLHVPFQDRMVVCKVRDIKLARKLGQLLYEEVMVHGEAVWLKTNWRIVEFEITDVSQPGKDPLGKALEALRAAGGDGWDKIDDPVAYIEEMTG